ncbi:hypothetical protein Pelo_11714 [Pelomyxa schiedti]|nr:hypothetical protein Pelo_11714 [Pelomyxa schiedti]
MSSGDTSLWVRVAQVRFLAKGKVKSSSCDLALAHHMSGQKKEKVLTLPINKSRPDGVCPKKILKCPKCNASGPHCVLESVHCGHTHYDCVLFAI